MTIHHRAKQFLLAAITNGVHSTVMLESSKTPPPNGNVADAGLGFELGLLFLTDADFFLRLASETRLQHQEPNNLSFFTPSSRETLFLRCFEVLTQVANSGRLSKDK